MEYRVRIDDFDVIVESQSRNICEEIVDQLRTLRIKRNMTQQDISDMTGIQRSNIARLEACTTTPSIDILIKYALALGYNLSIHLEEYETQRIGKNKETAINRSYITSGEYRRKFDLLTTSEELNKLIYTKAKEMLEHRTGTEYEDMFWIDMETCEVITDKLDETNIREIRHTKAIDKKLKSHNSILAMHTHPHSMPPSAADFNTYVKAGYTMGIIICHDGTVYRYEAGREISEKLMEMYINKFYLQIGDERTAQLMALDCMSDNCDIVYEEIII